MEFRQLDSSHKQEAKAMFGWENDPNYEKFCVVHKGPNEAPRHKNWQALLQCFNDPQVNRFGIYEKNKFIGEFNFVFDHPVALKKEPKTAWIGIGIGPEDYRGKGYGTLALEFIEAEVIKRGGKRIELGVFEFNHPAISLYKKLNYQHFETIPNFTYWDGKMWADLRFEKILL